MLTCTRVCFFFFFNCKFSFPVIEDIELFDVCLFFLIMTFLKWFKLLLMFLGGVISLPHFIRAKATDS